MMWPADELITRGLPLLVKGSRSLAEGTWTTGIGLNTSLEVLYQPRSTGQHYRYKVKVI